MAHVNYKMEDGKMTTGERTATQWDPNGATTDQVQFWSTHFTLIGPVSRDRARRLVARGLAYVITDQAIKQCEE